MSKQAEHTATPWRVNRSIVNPDGYVIAANGAQYKSNIAYIANDAGFTSADEQQANAAYIVQCVNSHTALVEALTQAASAIGQYLHDAGACDHSVGICMCGDRAVLEQAQAALKQAQGDK